jgi:glucokinase
MKDKTPIIINAAMQGDDAPPICVKTLDLFVSILAAEAGNLALKVLATGGLYLGGGIAPKMLGKLSGPLFMHAFVGKGRMQPLLEAMPVMVITNDKTALMGAARCAAANGST